MSTVAVPRSGHGPMPAPGRSGSVPAPSRITFLWRRTIVLGALLILAFALTVAIGRVGAEADPQSRVAGSVVVEPGETLWDVAVATAPEGMDPRRQLADLRELNTLTSSRLPAWTVVLVPAR